MAIPTALDKKIVIESMQLTDTEEFALRKMNTLSGESFRGFSSRSGCPKTPIMLLDEPTSFWTRFINN